MPTQTLTIAATGNDGYQDSGTTFDTTPAVGAIYVFGPTIPENLGASFPVTTAVPAGSTINDCRFRVSNNGGDDGGASVVNPQMQNIDPTSAAVWSNSNLPSGATAVSAHNTASLTWAENFYFGASDTSPVQFASDLQTVIDAGGGIAVGERVNFFVEWVSGTGFPSFRDLDATGTSDMQLFIDWTEGGAAALSIAPIIQNYRNMGLMN